MNILLINHYAGSPYYGMEFRPYYLAREWVKQGHNVTIIAASFSHLRQHNPEVVKDFQEEDFEGIKYVWFKTPEYGGSLARIKNMITFVWKLKKNSKRIAKNYQPDLVIAGSCYPLDNYSAHKIAKLSGAKYTYEVRDIWPLSPMLIGGYSKYHPFIWVMQKAEDYAYKHVDKVISLLWNAEEHMRDHGLAPGKFVCVPNGFSENEWTEDVFKQELPEVHSQAFQSLKGKTIIGFAGGFAASGTIDNLVEAANLLKDEKDLHFVLVGKGPEESVYRNQISKYGLNNVTILPAVPKVLVPTVIQHFDITFLGGVHSILHKYGTSPNKVTDYMLAAKPIVHAVDEPGSVVERLRCGIRVEAENPQKVAEAIKTIANLSPAERAEMGERGRDYTRKNLEWGVLADRFIKAFE